MRTFRRFLHDIRAFVRGRLTDDDLSDELDTFLEASVAHKMQSGMSREEATRTARLEMGSALIGIGLAGAIALTRHIEGMLYDVTPLDPLTYFAVVALFVAVTSLASYLPARRATRIDPMTALRYE